MYPMPCSRRVEPTDEQVEQDRIESEASFRRTIVALEVAAKWRTRPRPEEDRRDMVECPVCKGRLHLFQSSNNGHVHGRCETPKCVESME